MADSTLLKKDLFGEIRVTHGARGTAIVRDIRPARPWLRAIARRLLRREARALGALAGLDGVPRIIRLDRDQLVRSYLAGAPLHHARPREPRYFRAAAKLVRKLHAAGVVHNDLAKEPNLLVMDDGAPGLLDFQLAWSPRRRGKLFRILGHEDVRHLLKHKRTYCPDALTARERRILASPSVPARVWRNSGKRLYLFVTRRLLGWADREGAADRGSRQ